ncbi:MAG: hypothetical protein ACLFUG_11130, partial [Nitriliruptoraceae bacterium]
MLPDPQAPARQAAQLRYELARLRDRRTVRVALALSALPRYGPGPAWAAIRGQGADLAGLRAFCERELGLVLGTGLGEIADFSFRIGHMGWLNAAMVMG